MTDLDSSLSELNKEDTYSIMLLLLYLSTDNPRYSTLSELSYILDHDSFLNFIKFYEGQTIEVPTIQQTTDSLRLLILYQYYKVDNMDWHESLKLSGFTASESVSVKHKLNRFCNQLEKYGCKLGGIVNGIKNK
jgi:hypothetical protein